jgi:hypothetical protein
MIELDLLQQTLKLNSHSGRTQVFDPLRKSWVAFTPEEHVRQLLIQHLIQEMKYPPVLMAAERALPFGHTRLRFDLVVYDRQQFQPWMLVECKAPTEEINESVLQQLLRYYSKLPECRYWLLSNGRQNFCAELSAEGNVKWLDALPAY